MVVSLCDLIPGVALLPLAILWMGIGEGTIILIVVHSIIWPMSRSIMDGFRAVPQIYIESGENMGLGKLGLVTGIYIPASFSYILSGIRTGWARAWRGLISAEMIFGTTSSGAGIGWFIFMKRTNVVYGIAKMLNFAHGDIIMVGGYAAFISMNSLGVNPILAVILSVVICTILGLVIERVAYRPLRNASSPLAVLITAIGVSYLLQNLALLMFGADTKSFTSVVTVPAVVLAGGKLTISGETIVTVLACMIIMIGLTLFINKTKAGQAMLAVSEDRGAAQLMGINVNGTIALTFAIGSALAAIAAVLLCSAYPSLTPYTGAMPGIKAFVAAVFGGIGSIPGALIGGILLGIIEILGKAYISSQMADAIVFGVLIVVLLVKPSGLLGKQIQEKV